MVRWIRRREEEGNKEKRRSKEPDERGKHKHVTLQVRH